MLDCRDGEAIDRLRRLLDTHVLVFSSHPEFEEALLRFDPPLPAASAS